MKTLMEITCLLHAQFPEVWQRWIAQDLKCFYKDKMKSGQLKLKEKMFKENCPSSIKILECSSSLINHHK